MVKKIVPQPPRPIIFTRADPAALAQFDAATKQCTMNCGPSLDDPRSHKERLFLCDECITVESAAPAVAGRDAELLEDWIPVTDRLPDDDKMVLMALVDGEVWPGFRDGDIWRDTTAVPIPHDQVTDWMDLPPAPQRRTA